MNGNLNTAIYHEKVEWVKRLEKTNTSPRAFSTGMLGRCPRCETDGPCLEATCNSPGADWDWEPGDTCGDRPFVDEETATAYLGNSYFCTGAELVRFWHRGHPRWMWRGLQWSDAYHDGSVFGLMKQIAARMQDFREDDAKHGGSHAGWVKEKLLAMLEKM